MMETIFILLIISILSNIILLLKLNDDVKEIKKLPNDVIDFEMVDKLKKQGVVRWRYWMSDPD